MAPLVGGELLWPPSHTGAAETWGDFDASWSKLAAPLAAHQADGGRTVARRSKAGSGADRLLVFLPGTFTIPQQFSTVLKYAADIGFDTIGLDYAWGPAPDSKRSSQCKKTDACSACQGNYHDLIMTGQGESLIDGSWPVFGESQTDTLKFAHFFSTQVQFLPTAVMPVGVDLAAELNSKAIGYLEGMSAFAIEPLLTAVLKQLGWSEYLGPGDAPLWSKMVVAGHSQGASHAAYVAYKRPVFGAMAFSGPQDTCGDEGLAWFAVPAPESRRVLACYAEDEGGRTAIEKNLAFFAEVHTFNASGKPRNYGAGAWCASPAHCASAVDDQLVEEVVERCLPKLRAFVAGDEPPSSSARRPAAMAAGLLVLIAALVDRC